MSHLRRLLSYLKSFVARLFLRRPDRCVTLFGAEPLECEHLLKRAGFALQVPHDPAGMEELSGTSSNGPAFEALYLTGSRWKRLQRWAFHIPQRRGTSVSFDAGSWEKETGCAVACLRSNMLMEDRLSSDDVHALAGAVGRAAEKGRVRRVAIALTGMPSEIAPRHSSQVRLELPGNLTLRAGLDELLECARGKGGDPLADPSWRRFLGKQIAENSHLSTLAQILGRMTGRPCTLLFIPEEGARADLTPVMEWIHGKLPNVPRGPRRAVTAASSLAALALCAALGAGLSIPVAPMAAPALTSAGDLNADIDHLDGRYDSIALRGMGALASLRLQGRDALEGARKALRWREEVEKGMERDLYLGRCVNAALEKLSTLQTSDLAGRQEVANRLEKLLQEQMPVWRDIPSASAANALAGAAVLRAWLSLRPRGDDFGAWSMDEQTLTTSAGQVNEMLGGAAAEALIFAGHAESPADLDARYCAVSARPGPVGETTARFGPFLPRPDAKALLDRVEGMPLSELVKDLDTWKQRLASLISAGQAGCLAEGVSKELHDRAMALRTAAESATAPRPMLLAFTSSYQPRFHVDFSLRARDKFEGALRPLGVPEGCRAAVRMAPGGILYVAVNWATEEHVVGRSSGGRCGAAEIIPIVLDGAKGSIQAQGQTLNWEVIDGWPDWPARSPNTTSSQETKQ